MGFHLEGAHHVGHSLAVLEDLGQAHIRQLGVLACAVQQHVCRLYIKADYLQWHILDIREFLPNIWKKIVPRMCLRVQVSGAVIAADVRGCRMTQAECTEHALIQRDEHAISESTCRVQKAQWHATKAGVPGKTSVHGERQPTGHANAFKEEGQPSDFV